MFSVYRLLLLLLTCKKVNRPIYAIILSIYKEYVYSHEQSGGNGI